MPPKLGEDRPTPSTYNRPARQSQRMRVPDLIEDLHRRHRRRTARKFVLVGLALLLVAGLAMAGKFFVERQAREELLNDAKRHFSHGAMRELSSAARLLTPTSPTNDQPSTAQAHAMIRAQLWAEYGVEENTARNGAANIELASSSYEGAIAIGLLALTAGELERARTALARAMSLESERVLAPAHHLWLAAAIILTEPTRDTIEEIRHTLQNAQSLHPGAVALRRMNVALSVWDGERTQGLADLDAAREQQRQHMGLAADEALYNARFRQHIGGVASVAEQLLELASELSPRDRAHAHLALAAVQIYSGEREGGLARLEEVWPQLPKHDRVAKDLALELVIISGDTDTAYAWIDQARRPDTEADILRAWVQLSSGDIMASLSSLAELPQARPRVAYLQGLALVEQGRWKEGRPWLDRADELMPGQLDIEVAQARVELRLGDPEAALRKLEGLSEEEAFAPRVWTGLGEAYFALARKRGNKKDLLRAARRALGTAIEREHIPAEAMHVLAQVHDRTRRHAPKAPQEALRLFERAAATNVNLPRYAESLGTYLADLGHKERAIELLTKTIHRNGVGGQTTIRAIRLGIEIEEGPLKPDEKELAAWFKLAVERSAEPRAIERERARRDLAKGTRKSIQRAHKRAGKLLTQDPNDIESRLLYAQAALRLFDRKEAQTSVRRGLQVSPDDRHGRLYLQWASIESRTGARAKAAAHARFAWRKLLEEDRPPAELLHAATLSIRLFIELGKPLPAMAMARRVTKTIPYHARAWLLRARAELASKKATDARASATKAVELEGEDPAAHAMMGHCHMRFGHKKKARASYEKAVSLARSPRKRKQYREDLRRL
ncbi:MAG: tetratricopeptide repeat protein [Nannocystaceae bacterium]